MWDVRDVWMAHLALSDIEGGQFLHTERLNRAGAGIAGAILATRPRLERQLAGAMDLERRHAADRKPSPTRFSFDLSLRPETARHSRHRTASARRPKAQGALALHLVHAAGDARRPSCSDGKQFTVEGLSWMDHEFFTHQLDAGQSGWDWFSLQFDDGTELMLFRLRRKDGAADPYSAGTYIDARGRATHLTRDRFSVTPGKLWNKYPVEWTVSAPSLGIDVHLTTRLPQQEFESKQNRYWEGAVEIGGARRGCGYVEMTGYAAPVTL